MKKIAILLSVILSVTTLFVACSKSGADAGGNDVSAQTEYSGELAVNNAGFKKFTKVYNENHSFSYKDAGSYMVRNGKTAYRVVIPENATSDIEYAKSELSRFFKEATGIKTLRIARITDIYPSAIRIFIKALIVTTI